MQQTVAAQAWNKTIKQSPMILVEEADKIIQAHVRDFGTEPIEFQKSLGRILAEDLSADRDMPPFNRVTLDGIAVNHTALAGGNFVFRLRGTQAAGDLPLSTTKQDECIEIMTGAVLPETLDTVIGYEDLEINDGLATVTKSDLQKGNGIHFQGSDKKEKDILVTAGHLISPVTMSLAASIGKTRLLVKKLPKVVIITSGDELVAVDQTPYPQQIRRSNSYMLAAALAKYQVKTELWHIPDNMAVTKAKISEALVSFDVIIMSGGVSMGKFDFVYRALEEMAVEKLLHKVRQRPGKPFWFGKHETGALIFALPGNPVSAFLCLTRYCIPWLKTCLGVKTEPNVTALLNEDFSFSPSLQYFLQVQLQLDAHGQLWATPAEGNGSGDFANLTLADAFMELPMEQNNFVKGTAFTIWPFKEIIG